jgi:hypothetical protein
MLDSWCVTLDGPVKSQAEEKCQDDYVKNGLHSRTIATGAYSLSIKRGQQLVKGKVRRSEWRQDTPFMH